MHRLLFQWRTILHTTIQNFNAFRCHCLQVGLPFSVAVSVAQGFRGGDESVKAKMVYSTANDDGGKALAESLLQQDADSDFVGSADGLGNSRKTWDTSYGDKLLGEIFQDENGTS